jgi:hypothetical protein
MVGRAAQGDAMSTPDYAINAQVRRVLSRRWIRQQSLDVGTTDGVVLVRGRLEVEPGGPEVVDRDGLEWRVRRELARIPGVVDVVVEFHRPEGEGAR